MKQIPKVVRNTELMEWAHLKVEMSVVFIMFDIAFYHQMWRFCILCTVPAARSRAGLISC